MIQKSLESMVLISTGCVSAPMCDRPGVNVDWGSVDKKRSGYLC